MPVNVVTVIEKEVNEWDEFTGRLEAVESVEIRPRVSGYITEIHFEAGAIVKKGDLLYVIDPRPYQADFDRAAAEVERMHAQLKLAEIELDRAKELRARIRFPRASSTRRLLPIRVLPRRKLRPRRRRMPRR